MEYYIYGHVIKNSVKNNICINIIDDKKYNINDKIEYKNISSGLKLRTTIVKLLDNMSLYIKRSKIAEKYEKLGIDTSLMVIKDYSSSFHLICKKHDYMYKTEIGGSDCPICFAEISMSGIPEVYSRQKCLHTCKLHNKSGISMVNNVWVCEDCKKCKIFDTIYVTEKVPILSEYKIANPISEIQKY